MNLRSIPLHLTLRRGRMVCSPTIHLSEVTRILLCRNRCHLGWRQRDRTETAPSHYNRRSRTRWISCCCWFSWEPRRNCVWSDKGTCYSKLWTSGFLQMPLTLYRIKAGAGLHIPHSSIRIQWSWRNRRDIEVRCCIATRVCISKCSGWSDPWDCSDQSSLRATVWVSVVVSSPSWLSKCTVRCGSEARCLNSFGSSSHRYGYHQIIRYDPAWW